MTKSEGRNDNARVERATQSGGRWPLGMSLRQAAQVIETVQSRPMAVAEVEPQRVVPYLLPAEDLHAGKLPRAVAAVLIAEDVALALVFRTRGGGAQVFAREIRLGPIVPHDGEFVADELDVDGRLHGRKGTIYKPGRVAEGKTQAATRSPVGLLPDVSLSAIRGEPDYFRSGLV